MGLFGEPGGEFAEAVYDPLEAVRVGDKEDSDDEGGDDDLSHAVRIHLQSKAAIV